jgi:holliday junction DNA helicase RuvA
MISYIQGRMVVKTPTYVVIDTGHIGYRVHISLQTYSFIEALEEVKLHIHLHIKEDSHTLYGFYQEAERTLFLHLISVSGIGPVTAQIMLSSMNTVEITQAIIGENDLAFKKVKGIGPKTAKRIIIDLKDKLIKDSPEISEQPQLANNTLKIESLSALIALGFQRNAAIKAIDAVLKENPDILAVEVLIKKALQQML